MIYLSCPGGDEHLEPGGLCFIHHLLLLSLFSHPFELLFGVTVTPAVTHRNSKLCFFFFSHVFIWLCRVSVVACGIWFPCPGIEAGPPASGAQSLSPWTSREVPKLHFCQMSRPVRMSKCLQLSVELSLLFGPHCSKHQTILFASSVLTWPHYQDWSGAHLGCPHRILCFLST